MGFYKEILHSSFFKRCKSIKHRTIFFFKANEFFAGAYNYCIILKSGNIL